MTDVGRISLDPWDVARAHYERETHRFMAAIMRKLGVTQIELSLYDLMKDSTIERRDTSDGRSVFFRIVGELELKR